MGSRNTSWRDKERIQLPYFQLKQPPEKCSSSQDSHIGYFSARISETFKSYSSKLHYKHSFFIK